MTKWLIVSGLVVLNLILGTAVYQRLGERKATAQIGAGAKAEIATVAGQQNGQSVIFLMNVTTGALRAYRFDMTNRQTTLVGQRNVGQDLRNVQ
jgi:hypothetical protein